MTEAQSKDLLLVDDDESIRWVLNELLQDMGHKVTQANSAESALSVLEFHTFDLLITDVRMSGESGMELLSRCQSALPDMPVIIMTAHSDLESAVQAYQKGAFEYLPKPFDLDEVVATVNRALAPKPSVKSQQQADIKHNKFSIIGESPAMQDLYRAIGRLSNSQVTVLLHGESGTGKELVANALHQHSPREQAPFIALNMAAIPKDLIESELFGHEKGSFTGASGRYQGRFEQADNGTLFLDEIGDMPLETQTRLLRVLSEGAFYRIGSNQPTHVDVRIIAATHQDLHKKVESGEFREDLYHRLNVIPLHLPPLRQRSSDIPLLAEHFLNTISLELREPQKRLSREALAIMESYPWPGNVRQLENVCRWLSVMANSQLIMPQDLPPDIAPEIEQYAPPTQWQKQLSSKLVSDYQKGDHQAFIKVQAELEQLIIQTALEITLGKKAEASKILGWGRNTLTRKLKI
ncbi:nitrogen regulation protein NR(I) [Aliikangiella coralliicola]|uniref:DNA-binding transcriptional regulator NtrC n=1 Tax=Aliikangiella coralliicola TaxID=2592383 RepID=A0A545UHC0_9GAMM|nr:nitrogen regulation protein NR(I) [Aliikangiella coralliicola]TQV88871.1 nitrogen regulation protein NR(I) [Aliikangiella coralliicola]